MYSVDGCNSVVEKWTADQEVLGSNPLCTLLWHLLNETLSLVFKVFVYYDLFYCLLAWNALISMKCCTINMFLWLGAVEFCLVLLYISAVYFSFISYPDKPSIPPLVTVLLCYLRPLVSVPAGEMYSVVSQGFRDRYCVWESPGTWVRGHLVWCPEVRKFGGQEVRRSGGSGGSSALLSSLSFVLLFPAPDRKSVV